MKLTFKYFIAFSFLVSLSSCDYFYTYQYSVTNQADTTVFIQCFAKGTTTDTNINKDQTIILFNTSHGAEDRKGPFFRDVDRDLEIFTVTKKGVNSTRNYLINENWNFGTGDDGVGDYTTTVLNSEF